MTFSSWRVSAGLCLTYLAVAVLPLHAQEGTVTATLSPAQPPQEAVISHIGDNPSGWQWRWANDTGRRDVGQTFTATSDFTLDKIALSVHTGAVAAVSHAPFTLTLSQYPDAQASAAAEKLGAWHGELPDNSNGNAYRQDAWLIFDVPDCKLQKGNVYGFVLQFDAAKPTGQGVVFSVPQVEAYPEGRSLYSTDGQNWRSSLDFNFVIIAARAPLRPVAPPRAPRTLNVDQGGTAEFKSLAAAAKVARPGDTIWIKPNSGPYREILRITTSGTEQAPITVEGNGNVITGFEPLTDWTTQNGTTTCHLPFFPCVLTYKGERLLQDFTSKQYTKYATINDAKDTLTLLPNTSSEGWEISKRAFAVQILNVSYQTYKNLRTTGSTNDGFNLHGTGQGLIFENIEAFNNLDEGYSAHDNITSEIRGAKFWSNDNGVSNIGHSDTKMSQVDMWANLGFGFWLNECTADLKDVRCWGNGGDQIFFRKATIKLDNVQTFTPTTPARPWVSYQETIGAKTSRAYADLDSQLTGKVIVHPEPAPKE